jgi:hypothetical protein
MRKYLFFALVYVLGMLQVSLPGGPFFWRIKPDFLLSSAVMAGLAFDLRFAVCAAFFAGMMKDTLTHASPHFYAVTFCLWCIGAWYAGHKLVINSHPMRTAVVYIAALCQTLLGGAVGMSSGRLIPAGIVARIALAGPVYTALVSVGVWWMIMTVCRSGRSRVEEERVW